MQTLNKLSCGICRSKIFQIFFSNFGFQHIIQSYYFQADTEDLYNRWITSLQEAIKRAIKQDTKSDPIGEDSPKGGAEASKDAWGDDSDNEEHDSTKKRRGVKPSAKQILLIPGT